MVISWENLSPSAHGLQGCEGLALDMHCRVWGILVLSTLESLGQSVLSPHLKSVNTVLTDPTITCPSRSYILHYPPPRLPNRPHTQYFSLPQ